jgi:thioredoxin-like negative regulator of GroEL
MSVEPVIEAITVPPQKFKNSLVYYYMPRCPYCQEFAPVLVELMHLVRKAKHLQIRAVDITQHSGVGVPVRTVPTVYYFDNDGTPIKLNASSREERSLVRVATFLVEEYLKDHYRRKQDLLQRSV